MRKCCSKIVKVSTAIVVLVSLVSEHCIAQTRESAPPDAELFGTPTHTENPDPEESPNAIPTASYGQRPVYKRSRSRDQHLAPEQEPEEREAAREKRDPAEIELDEVFGQ
jgi:hypothetical protein